MKKDAVKLIAGIYADMMRKLDPSTDWQVVEDIDGIVQIALIVIDMEITNPMISSCGRFEYDMTNACMQYELSADTITVLMAVNKYLESLQD